jgi:hypothetical protein
MPTPPASLQAGKPLRARSECGTVLPAAKHGEGRTMGRPKLEHGEINWERVDRIRAMRQEGFTYAEIGRELGVTRQAVQCMAVRYGVEKQPGDLGRRKCPVCSASFDPRTKTQRCCSYECGKARLALLDGRVSYLPRRCDECGTIFQPKSVRGRFCRQQCRSRKKNREYQRFLAAKRRGEVVRDCDR